MNDVTCLIPSRLGSTRFFGKSLENINDDPMVVMVAKNAVKAFGKNNIIVLTDHKKIYDLCDKNNIKCEITKSCNNATERILQYYEKIKTEYIIELQGDEPLIFSEDLLSLYNKGKETKSPTCIISPLHESQIDDENICKAIVNKKEDRIFYVTRFALNTNFRHVGVYMYNKSQLMDFCKKETNIELIENIHPLKWIELGYTYNCAKINHYTHGVDVPKDIFVVKTLLEYKDFNT
jgi:3-deoxy-manno-octulosonate cytidylyltransferase (CMP-KDO synthetase)